MKLFYDIESIDEFFSLFEEAKMKIWNSKCYKIVFKQFDEFDENNDQIINIFKLILKIEPAKRVTIDQCLKKDFENDLFRMNRFGEIVFSEVIKVNTKINTFIGNAFFDFDSNYGTKTPTLLDTANALFVISISEFL